MQMQMNSPLKQAEANRSLAAERATAAGGQQEIPFFQTLVGKHGDAGSEWGRSYAKP
jgi:hypothetical protein